MWECCAAKFWIYWAFTFMTLSFFTFYGQVCFAAAWPFRAPCLTSMHPILSDIIVKRRKK